MTVSSLLPPGAGRQGWMPRAAAGAAVAATLGNTPTEGDRSTIGTEVRILTKPKTPVAYSRSRDQCPFTVAIGWLI
jgi:hypothetical protein